MLRGEGLYGGKPRAEGKPLKVGKSKSRMVRPLANPTIWLRTTGELPMACWSGETPRNLELAEELALDTPEQQ